MVKERRYVFDLQDIASLIYACSHCGQEVVCKLDSPYEPATHCVSCNERLAPNRADGIDPNRTLLVNLRRVLKVADPSVRVRFVVPDPD